MKIKNGMVFHPADNTILTCPSATYKYHYGTYCISKIWFIIVAVLGIIVSCIFLFITSDARIQTFCATIIGGLLNIIVWLATTFITDKIKHEQDEIERLIYVVERHIDSIHKEIIQIDEQNYTIKEVNEGKLWFHFLWHLQICLNLLVDNDIDTSRLVLKWNGRDYFLSEYCSLCNQQIDERKIVLDEEYVKLIDWNLYEIETQLKMLQEKLCRYKSYLSSSKPPVPYELLNRKE